MLFFLALKFFVLLFTNFDYNSVRLLIKANQSHSTRFLTLNTCVWKEPTINLAFDVLTTQLKCYVGISRENRKSAIPPKTFDRQYIHAFRHPNSLVLTHVIYTCQKQFVKMCFSHKKCRFSNTR